MHYDEFGHAYSQDAHGNLHRVHSLDLDHRNTTTKITSTRINITTGNALLDLRAPPKAEPPTPAADLASHVETYDFRPTKRVSGDRRGSAA